jgi:hypothetical protein
VTSRDHLVEKIRGLPIESQIPQFVADEECGLGVGLEFADQRVIHLRGEQTIEHVHGGGEHHTLIRLASPPANNFRQECLSDTRISDQDQVGSLGEETQIEQAQDAILILRAGLVMVEVKRVDARLCL